MTKHFAVALALTVSTVYLSACADVSGPEPPSGDTWHGALVDVDGLPEEARDAVEAALSHDHDRGAMFYDNRLVGFFSAGFWEDGSLRHICTFAGDPDNGFLRVNPDGSASAHLAGPASASLFLRFDEDGLPLPELMGDGSINMDFTGQFVEIELPFGTLRLVVPPFSTARHFGGVARVSDLEESEWSTLQCRVLDSANGEPRVRSIELR